MTQQICKATQKKKFFLVELRILRNEIQRIFKVNGGRRAIGPPGEFEEYVVDPETDT